MIRASCHCTAVRFEIESSPTWILDCNCTLCRRYGALWAYYKPEEVVLVQGTGDTDNYSWQDHDLGFHWCKKCGCLTHHTILKADPPTIRGINARMIPTLSPADVQIWHIDNSHTGYFWTRDPDKFKQGSHPVMPPPGPEDWR
jgi:hypothetical protein